MRTIYFWPDGCWCEAGEIEHMLHKASEPAEMLVSIAETNDGVDELVREAPL